MYLFIFALFLLTLTSSSPLPISHLSPRAGCVNPELTPFYVQNFQLFTGESTSSISFNYINNPSGIMTTCQRLLAGDGITAASISVADATTWTQCSDAVVAFSWDGTRLSVLHGWSCDGVR